MTASTHCLHFSPLGSLVFPCKLQHEDMQPLEINDPVKLLETFFDHPVEFRA